MPSVPSQFPVLGAAEWQIISGLILVCCCIFLIAIVIGTIVHYVARAALYRSVDQIEETGVAPKWREGFRLGWSNRSFRMWLLDLIVGIPFFIAAMLLLLLGATPLLLLAVDSSAAKALGVIATIGLELLIMLADHDRGRHRWACWANSGRGRSRSPIGAWDKRWPQGTRWCGAA